MELEIPPFFSEMSESHDQIPSFRLILWYLSGEGWREQNANTVCRFRCKRKISSVSEGAKPFRSSVCVMISTEIL